MKNYQELELEILRKAVDESQERIGKKAVQSPEIQDIIKVVEMFLRKKGLICYGGIAVNNILPEDDQFYNRETEIPDYDFYSPNALEDATELANIYYSKGYTEVEAKAGQHSGTFKVFVNFIGVADITQVPRDLFETIERDSIVIDGIHYVSANFLRMGVYKELSNPDGDTSRFEKIYKRMALLNKYYPITDLNCNKVEYRRKMEDESHKEEIYQTLLTTFTNYGCVFFGGHALSIYSEYMPARAKAKFENVNPDFDVLSNEPEDVINQLKKAFQTQKLKIRIISHPPVGEIVPPSYEIVVGKDTVAFIYKTERCHSYNEIIVNGKKVKIATIDTMLHLYFSFLYADKPYYDHTRIICMCNFLFNVQQENKLSQKGVLKRFSTTCYGHQEQLEEMKLKRSKLYKKLKGNPEDPEYKFNFFNYKPAEDFNPITAPISRPHNKQKQKYRHLTPKSLLSKTPAAIPTLKTIKKKPFFDKSVKRKKGGPYNRNYLASFKHKKTRKGKKHYGIEMV
jgi:hypothetical protein